MAPPSVLRITPNPGLPSLASELALPVPAKIVDAESGLIAIESIDRPGSFRSVSGAHRGAVAFAFVLFQIPPLTVPR